jgi:hypothetical protein
MASNIVFSCSMNKKPTSIEVSYTITNNGSQDLGAFNRLQGIGVDGGLFFSANNVFVDLEGDTLHLMKMALPIPQGLQIAAYIPPHVSRIPAGESFTETFVLALPARVAQPFKRALIRGQVAAVTPASATKARVTIGVFPVLPELRLLAEQPAYPDVLTVQPPGPALEGQELLSQAFSLDPEASVLDYQGFPWS